MNLESAVIASLGSFLVGMAIPLAFVYPKMSNLETKLANACDSIRRIEEGKVNIICPRHDDLTKRVENLENNPK